MGRPQAVFGGLPAGILAGALGSGANALLNPIIILSLFAAGLTTSWYVVALPTVVSGVVWIVGAAIAGADGVRSSPRQWTIAAHIVALATVMGLAFVANHRERYGDAAMVRALVVCYGVCVLASAIATRTDNQIAIALVPGRWRVTFFSLRALAGTVVAFLLAIVGGLILSNDVTPFPDNFAVAFVAAAICLAIAAYFQTTSAVAARLPVQRTVVGAVSDAPSRGAGRLIAYRWLMAGAALADPFLVVYAVRHVNVSLQFAGIYVAALVAGRTLTQPLWERLARRFGMRAALQLVTVVRVLAPLLALMLSQLFDASLWTDHVTTANVAAWTFGLVFVCIGAVNGGQSRLMHRASADAGLMSRTTGRTVASLVMVVAACAPLVGAAIYTRWGWEPMLLSAAGVGLAGLIMSGALSAVPGRPRVVGGAIPGQRPSPRHADRGGILRT